MACGGSCWKASIKKNVVRNDEGRGVGGIVDKRCPDNSHPDTLRIRGCKPICSPIRRAHHRRDLAWYERRPNLIVELYERAQAAYQAKEDLVGASLMREAERNIMLHVIDDQWKDHLLSMDHLKEGIGLRGYGQKDPLVEYKKESYTPFQDYDDRIEDETVRYLYFLRFEQNLGSLPFANDDSEQPRKTREAAERKKIEVSKALEEQQRLAAQSAVQDMTRNIQKQHERELKDLQFAGTNGSGTANQTVVNGAPKSDATTRAPVAAARSTRNATEHETVRRRPIILKSP